MAIIEKASTYYLLKSQPDLEVLATSTSPSGLANNSIYPYVDGEFQLYSFSDQLSKAERAEFEQQFSLLKNQVKIEPDLYLQGRSL